jgi:hypothetical protein
MNSLTLVARLTSARRRFLLSAALIMMSLPAAAQRGGAGEPGTPAEQACRARAGAFKSGNAQQKVDQFAHLKACPVEGPAILAEAWDAPSSDTASLRALSYASAMMRDERLLAKLLTTVANRGASTETRAAALMSAHNQIYRGGYMRFGGMLPGRHDTLVAVAIGASIGGMYRPADGNVPHVGDPVARLRAVLKGVVKNSTEDAYLRALAKTIWAEWMFPPLEKD